MLFTGRLGWRRLSWVAGSSPILPIRRDNKKVPGILERVLNIQDFLIVALDLLSGLVEALGSHIEGLVSSSELLSQMSTCIRVSYPQIELVRVISSYFQDLSAEVRQSAFALLGDLTKACPTLILPRVPDVMSAIALNLDPAHTSVCNNAAWSAGEIALKVGAEMKDFIPMLAKPLVEVMNRANVRTLLENTAITLGR